MRGWTRREVRTARLAREDGESLERIAAALGRSRDSVMNKLRREGVDKSLTSDERCLFLCRLGLPLAAVAEVLGTSLGAVQTARWRLRRVGFEMPDGRRGRKMPSRSR